MARGDLFPEIAPYESGFLPLTQGHVMYWEQSGNPRGKPVLFLHGGPGAGAGSVHRRFFDPGFWRIVIFDQRGAGRSRPLGELRDNTTQHLIEDIETLRRYLDIERFLLFGGSWGSTLALAYAQAHQQRVIGMVLRGVFLGRPSEIDWFLQGMGRIFPECHAAFIGHLSEDERRDVLGSYLARLTSPQSAVQMAAAKAWSMYEGNCSTLLPSPDTVAAFANDRAALGLARIEAHYFSNGLFLPPGGLLAGMELLRDIPSEIVQGRYDIVCPPVTAFDLVAHWPKARLTMVADAGHSALESGARRGLVAAVERFRTL